MQLTPYRKAILIVQFSALFILVGSMFIFAKMAADTPPAPELWLIPIIASLLVISGFAANLHIRWIENPDTQAATKTQKFFVYIVIFSLYAIWFIALAQAWLANQQLDN